MLHEKYKYNVWVLSIIFVKFMML